MKRFKLNSSQIICLSLTFGMAIAMTLTNGTVRVMAASDAESYPIGDGRSAGAGMTGSGRQGSHIGAASDAAVLSAASFVCGDMAFFQPPGSPFSAGGGIGSVVAGDFNMDGKRDLAFGNSGNFFSAGNTVTILLGDGLGGFSQASGSPITVGNGPDSIAIADFNKDGKPDLATADIFSDTTSIILGNGMGGFAHATGSPIAIPGIFPTAVTAGDWNEDDNPDIAISSTAFGISRVAIMLGDGTGQFTQASGSPIELILNWNPTDIQTDDFNLDGKDDLVTANLFGFNVGVFLGDGNGGFTVIGSPIIAPKAVRSVRTGDFNLDGKPDVSVVSASGFVGDTNQLIILLGDGTGQMSTAPGSPYQTGDNPFDQAVADFNMDGIPDIAVLNDGVANNLKLLLGDGTGRFSPPPNSLLGVGDLPNAITADDLNLDGKPDLAVGTFTQGHAVILLNNCSPLAQCKDVTVVAGPGCNANASINDGSFDPDGDAVTILQTPPGPYPVGTTTVTLTIFDSHGASSSCAATVTVIDGQVPMLSNCPGNIVKSADPGACSAVATYTEPTASDACGTVTVECNPPPGSTFQKGRTTVDCAATDASGNRVTCFFTVTVNDTQAPMINCPADITKSTDPNACSAAATWNAPVVSDNCDASLAATCTPPSGSTFQKGATSVTCAATDAAGNTSQCQLTVTVIDTVAPVLASSNLSIGTISTSCSAVATFSPTVTDNCDTSLTATCMPPSGSTFPKGTTNVNCTATDAAGNQGQNSFNVVVVDDDKPVLSCPSNIVVNNAAGQCSAQVSFTASASDNCDGSLAPICKIGSTVITSPHAFAKGMTVVSCSATDSAGNTSNCSFTVTVNDTEPPKITCPQNIIRKTVGSSLATSVVVNYPAPVATDNCAVASILCSPPSGSSFPLGTTTVNCTAADTSNNTASCSFTVSVLFDAWLADDANGKIIRFNTRTGDYEFYDCRKGTSLSGRGVVAISFCKIELRDTGPNPRQPDRNVVVTINNCTRQASATIRVSATGANHTLNDSNINNSPPGCP